MNSFEVFVDHDLKIIRVTVSGEMFHADGKKIITLARQTAAQHSYNVLYDIRNATTTVAFAEWFHLPRELQVFKDLQTRRVKAAVLASPQDKAVEDYKFYETVLDNLGISLRLFFDEENATSWLNATIKSD